MIWHVSLKANDRFDLFHCRSDLELRTYLQVYSTRPTKGRAPKGRVKTLPLRVLAFIYRPGDENPFFVIRGTLSSDPDWTTLSSISEMPPSDPSRAAETFLND